MRQDNGPDSHADARRKIVARATLYLYTFLGAAVVVAIGGAALMAWLLSRIGFPFRETWIVLVIVIVLPSVLMLLWRATRDRARGRR